MTERRYVLALAALGALAAAPGRAQAPASLATRAVATVRDLKKLGAADAPLALAAGYHEAGDGGGGLFLWQAQSRERADDGLVFAAADAAPAGRWRRLFDGPIDVRMFGARGDGKTDDSAAIQAAIDSAQGAEVRLPAGTWVIGRTLRFRSLAGRHSAGLKLIGEGPYVTVIESRVTEGPAISIEQAEGYRFGTHGVLRDFDLVGSAAAAGRDQHGIVASGAWQYRFDRIVVRSFRGHGLFVPFVSDRGGRYPGFELVAGSNIARRPKGGLDNALSRDEVIEGRGIAPGTVVEGQPDDHTVVMSKPALESGTAELNIWGRNPDGQTSLISLADCRIVFNGGWGIASDAVIGCALVLRDTQIGNNEGGGLRSGGMVDMVNGTCTDNGSDDGRGAGFLFDAPSRTGVADLVRLDGVEIDGNRGECNLWLRRVRHATITRCRFNASERPKLGRQVPAVNIRLGDSDGSAALTVNFSQIQVRTGGIYHWPHTAFEIPDGAYIENVVARDTMFWGGWSDKVHTRYRIGKTARADARIVFEEAGVPADGRAVPAAWLVQLRNAERPIVVAPGAVAVLPLAVTLASTPRLTRNWTVGRLDGVEVAAGGGEARLAAPPDPPIKDGTPLLILDKGAARVGRVVRAAARAVTFDRPFEQDWKGPVFLGGLTLPFEAFYSVETALDLLAAGPQGVLVTLLADGKPAHVHHGTALGLPRPQTVAFSALGHWAAGTVLHLLVQNDGAKDLSLGGAAMTVTLQK